MNSASPFPYTQVETTSQLVTLNAFYGILWMAFAICFLAFISRLYIRYRCFNRLLVDDWIMLFAITLLLAVVIVAQVFLRDVYDIVSFENGEKMADASFPRTMVNGLRGFGASLTISLVGILAVKINFLLFFKRLGTQITSYLVFWYIVLFITVACGATNIGLMDYKCVFSNFEYTFTECTQRSVIKRYMDFMLVSVILDVVSDVSIICFPVVILWKVRISLRKKIILSCTFGLVALTIAVTIVRGSVFGGTYKSFSNNEMRNLNMGWMIFWIYIEFAVAFLIACIISFRALFAQREKQSYENENRRREEAFQRNEAISTSRRLRDLGIVRRARRLHDTLLESFRSLETMDRIQLPELELGRFSPTFITDIENSHATQEQARIQQDSITSSRKEDSLRDPLERS